MTWFAVAIMLFGLIALFVVLTTIGLLWAHRH